MLDAVTRPFSMKITSKIAPEYNTVVQRPMDLSKIVKSIAAGEYTNYLDVDTDVQQVESS